MDPADIYFSLDKQRLPWTAIAVLCTVYLDSEHKGPGMTQSQMTVEGPDRSGFLPVQGCVEGPLGTFSRPVSKPPAGYHPSIF